MKLSGNKILITGGATGIGLAMAARFLQLGNRVAICGRRMDKLDQAKKTYPNLAIYQCDVSDAQQRQKLYDNLVADNMAPNVLINNAAIMRFYTLSKPETLDMDSIENDIKTNLLAPIALTTLFLPILRQQPNPVIINVTSPVGLVALSEVPIYSATKAALNSFTQSLHHQLKGSVEIIEIYPPSVATDMTQEVSLQKISVEEFNNELFEQLESGGKSLWIGDGKYLKWIHRISPTLAAWVVNRTTQSAIG